MGGAIKGALAAVSLAVKEGLDFRAKLPEAKAAPPPDVSRGNNRKGFYINTPSLQKASLDRLIIDRASSVRKVDRWTRNGTLLSSKPKTDRHLMRHGWYRRKLRNEKPDAECYP